MSIVTDLSILFGSTGAIISGTLAYVASVRAKRVDVTEKALERQAGEIVEVHKRNNQMQAELDAVRQHSLDLAESNAKLKIELMEKVSEFNQQLLKVEETYKKRIELLEEENSLLRARNVELEGQLAQASVMGIVERRQGEPPKHRPQGVENDDTLPKGNARATSGARDTSPA